MDGGCILAMVPMEMLSIMIIGVVVGGVNDGGGIRAIMLSKVEWLLTRCVRSSSV